MNDQHPGKPALTLEDCIIGYNRTPLFGRFSLDVRAATFNVVVGANGSGKSTLLKTVGGSLKPIGGRIVVDGTDIRTLSTRRLARKISVVYTERFTGAGGLTVRELVETGRHPYTGLLGNLSDVDTAAVDAALDDVGIAHKAGDFLSDISDGELQKALIARTLAQQTPIIILDEPTNYLDVASRIEILTLVAELVRRKNITVIMSTHDIAAALSVADNVITILPDDEAPVAVAPVDSADAIGRLDRVFARRGIRYDASLRTYLPIVE